MAAVRIYVYGVNLAYTYGEGYDMQDDGDGSIRDTNIGSIDRDGRIAVYDRVRRLSSAHAGLRSHQ